MSYDSLPAAVYQGDTAKGKNRTIYVSWDALHRKNDGGYYIMDAGPYVKSNYYRLAGPFVTPDAAQEALDSMADEKGWMISECN